MRQRRIQLAAAVAIVSIVSVVATTAVAGNGNNAKAKLDGFQEVPAVLTDGSGKFKAKISEQKIDYTLSYKDIEGGAVTAAHIHIGQRLANGGIAAFLCGGGGKPPCPPSPATVTGTILPTDVMAVPAQGVLTFADLVEAMRKRITYANVHSTRSPNGEIRGQIKSGGDGD